MGTAVRIRDTHDNGYFTIPNYVLDEYAERMGPFGIAVYAALRRYTWGRSDEVCVSHRGAIARKAGGISTKQVSREVHKLRDLGLLSLEIKRQQTGMEWVLTILDPRNVTGVQNTLGDTQSSPERTDSLPIKDVVRKDIPYGVTPSPIGKEKKKEGLMPLLHNGPLALPDFIEAARSVSENRGKVVASFVGFYRGHTGAEGSKALGSRLAGYLKAKGWDVEVAAKHLMAGICQAQDDPISYATKIGTGKGWYEEPAPSYHLPWSG